MARNLSASTIGGTECCGVNVALEDSRGISLDAQPESSAGRQQLDDLAYRRHAALVIAPAAFTRTHRGNPPRGGDA